MFCTKCGTKLEDNMKFCVKCGTPVGEHAQLQADYTPTVQPVWQEEQGIPQKEKASPLKVILLLLVLILILWNQMV